MAILEEIAAALSCIEYPVKIPPEIQRKAKEHGVVIVYGASDDLVEFEGAIYDEADVDIDGNTTVYIDREGVLSANSPRSESAVPVKVMGGGAPENDWMGVVTWAYDVPEDIYCRRFDVMEGDDVYCIGMIFKLPAKTHEPNAGTSPTWDAYEASKQERQAVYRRLAD